MFGEGLAGAQHAGSQDAAPASPNAFRIAPPLGPSRRRQSSITPVGNAPASLFGGAEAPQRRHSFFAGQEADAFREAVHREMDRVASSLTRVHEELMAQKDSHLQVLQQRLGVSQPRPPAPEVVSESSTDSSGDESLGSKVSSALQPNGQGRQSITDMMASVAPRLARRVSMWGASMGLTNQRREDPPVVKATAGGDASLLVVVPAERGVAAPPARGPAPSPSLQGGGAAVRKSLAPQSPKHRQDAWGPLQHGALASDTGPPPGGRKSGLSVGPPEGEAPELTEAVGSASRPSSAKAIEGASEEQSEDPAVVCRSSSKEGVREVGHRNTVKFEDSIGGIREEGAQHRPSEAQHRHSEAACSFARGGSDLGVVSSGEPHFPMHEAWTVTFSKRKDRSLRRSNFSFNADSNDVQDQDEFFEGEIFRDSISAFARYIFSPSSFGRVSWDMAGLTLMAYESIVLPLQFFDVQGFSLFIAMAWVIRLFWTVDLPFQFFTGYATREGSVEMRPWKVWRHYVRTWFIIDLLMLATDWLEVFLGGFGSLNAARAGKALKSLRIIRVTRMLKLLHLLMVRDMPSEVKTLIGSYGRSEVGLICLGILRMFLCWLWFNHVLGCCWYGLAQISDADGKTWLVKYGYDKTGQLERYIVCFNWSLALFASSIDIFPVNIYERAYTICAILVAFMASAYIVSSITSSMTRLSIATAQDAKKFLALRQYLFENDISGKIADRVQRNARYALEEKKRRTPESEIELLDLISNPLRIELHYEIHIPVLRWHPFFDVYSEEDPALLRQICHNALAQIFLAHDDLLFCEGQPSQPHQQMYFVTRGQLRYLHRYTPAEMVGVGAWACEAVLWTPTWLFCGTMRAKTDSLILTLQSEAFQRYASQFKDTIAYAKRYVRLFLKHISEIDEEELTDLDDPDMDVHWLATKSRTETDSPPPAFIKSRRSRSGSNRISKLLSNTSRASHHSRESTSTGVRTIGSNNRVGAFRSSASASVDKHRSSETGLSARRQTVESVAAHPIEEDMDEEDTIR